MSLFTQVELQAYAKAAQALRALSHPIDSGAQAKAIKGIGAGMANRIDAAWLHALTMMKSLMSLSLTQSQRM